jgi:hypothetical protein
MSNTHDRRAPGTARIPFDAMVEVGGALGPSFEAQAVNLSEEGMSLRTAYLPDVGQPVMCRFDAGRGHSVVAAGEVLWKDDMGDGGEFGIRFTNLDAESAVALQRVLGTTGEGQPPMEIGRKVRLHIEGLASPMRARIRDQMTAGVTAYSELGFLQMGKPLDLEDATSGSRRPALIDRVEVEVAEGSRIPQLVVSLRYDDEESRIALASEAAAPPMQLAEGGHDDPELDGESPPAPHHPEDVQEPDHGHSHAHDPGPGEARATDAGSSHSSDEREGGLKSAFSRNAAKVTPAILGWAKRAKVAAALLAARARRPRGDGDVEIPIRRTTAPAPGGGLHTAGRKVVRGSVPDDRFEDEPAEVKKRFTITKKKIAIAASMGIAVLLVFLALRKPSTAPQLASAPPADPTSVTTTTPGALVGPGGASAAGTNKPLAPPNDPLAAAAAAMAQKPGKVTPFTNGPVGAHPNVIKIKMDGIVDGIQGAPQPTGFTIVIPNRKSIEPTASLAEKDPRISAVHVANEPGGAEFSITFKDGVPNYLVRAHGDTLEMVLAHTSAHGDKSEAKVSKKKHGAKKH